MAVPQAEVGIMIPVNMRIKTDTNIANGAMGLPEALQQWMP